MGFSPHADQFGIFLGALVMVAICAGSAAYFCACVTPLFIVANQLVGLIYVFGMLFSGLLINTADLPSWLRWAEWLSFYRYAMSILAKNEFENQTFECTTDQVNKGCFQNGNDVLEQFEWTDPFLTSFLGLAALAVGFFLGGLFALQQASRRK